MSDAQNTDEPDDSEPHLTVPGRDGTSSIAPNSIEGVFLLALQKEDPAERDA
ncbi:MAG: hypothetical protein P8J37_22695 [Fuerstiella sp.]|nr:hypothetical protein [Fuerstiella sp.]